jgi:hypothetical protein
MWKRKTDKTISNIKIVKCWKGKYRKGINNRGYPVIDIKKGEWNLTHQINALEKYDLEKIPKDFHIHHINPDKKNKKFNHPDNLIIVHKKDHKNIHKIKRELKEDENEK